MALTTINRPDSQKALFGTGDDLEIYHNGTRNYIDSKGTQLRIETDELRLRSDGGETYAQANVNGAFEAHYDNVKKFETTDVGVQATGHIFSTTKFRGNDDVKVSLGTSEDLQLYHDGSNSFIKNSTGHLKILADSVSWRNEADGEDIAYFVADGACQLYHNNSKKLETHSNGVTVTGRISVSGNSGVGLIHGDSVKAVFGDGDDLEILHDGTDTYINNGTGDLYVRTTGSGDDLHLRAVDDVQIKVQTSEDSVICKGNGAVELYYDGAKKLSTDTGGVLVDDDVKYMAGNSADLRIYHSGDWNYIQSHNSKNFALQVKDTENALIAIPDGAVQLYHNNNKVFETNGAGATIYATEGGDAEFNLYADEGDDNADKWRILAGQGGSWAVKNYAPGSWDTFIQATINAGVELYYDNSKKFETTSGGAQVTGNMVADAFYLGDNERFYCGNGDDLQIYHNGSKSYIKDLGTGSLRICSNDLRIMNADDDEIMFRAEEDDAITLYHNNSAKLSTTGSGCTVTGSVTETSDVALKTNIEPLNNVLDKIQQITGYKYQFKDTGHDSMGVTAQDVEKVFPELVHGEEGTKTLQYSGLIGALIESVKELSNKVAALEAK